MLKTTTKKPKTFDLLKLYIIFFTIKIDNFKFFKITKLIKL